jgi:hypothetical protein
MCSRNNETTPMQHLSKDFWSKGKSEKAFSNDSLKQDKYKCDLCKLTAYKHDAVRKHIDCVHEKLKQHQCSICQMSFGEKGTPN